MEIFILWLFAAVISSAIASSKGRSGKQWFILGFFFGPLAILIILLSRSKPSIRSQNIDSRALSASAERERANPVNLPGLLPPPQSGVEYNLRISAEGNQPSSHIDRTRLQNRIPASATSSSFDDAVSVVYPFLRSGEIPLADFKMLDRIADASDLLVHFPLQFAGVALETMRSLSIEHNRRMIQEPNNPIARIFGRAIIGKGEDDSSVATYIQTECKQLLSRVRTAQVDLIINDQMNSARDETLRNLMCEWCLGYTLGIQNVSIPVTEESFESGVQLFRRRISDFSNPEVVIDLMISYGPQPPISEWKRLSKRFRKGQLTPGAIEAIKRHLMTKRPAIQQAAQVQRVMGWKAISWDPLEAVPGRHYRN